MPHVVIAGPLDPARVHREVAAFEERRGGTVMKVRESFLARSGKTVLLEAVVVEAGVSRRFLVQVDGRDGELTVRLFPPTDPEKTEGVKRLLVRVAREILAIEPAAEVRRTNLGGLLAPAAAGEAAS